MGTTVEAEGSQQDTSVYTQTHKHTVRILAELSHRLKAAVERHRNVAVIEAHTLYHTHTHTTG